MPIATVRRLAYRGAARALPALGRGLASLRVRGLRRLSVHGRRLCQRCEVWFQEGAFSAQRGGFAWRLTLEDNLQRRLFVRGSYDPELSRYLCAALTPGARVLDVGANIGVHALPLARTLRALGAGEVVAFEPARESRESLLRHVADNALGDQVRIVPLGLSDRAGIAPLRRSTRWKAGDLGTRSLHGDGEVCDEVRLVRLDDWVEAQQIDRIDVMKLDVEGAEHAALLGMPRTLARLRPRILVLEVVDALLRQAGSSAEAVLALLSASGYRPYALEAGTLRPWQEARSANAIFTQGRA